MNGHALTLQIVGQYLVRAHHGDIRRRDRIDFAKAEHRIPGDPGFHSDHAFRAIAAYEEWLDDDSEESRRELAVLRLLGLFDRPATADCVQALLTPPAIDGLTDPLAGLADEDREFTLTTLSDARLVSVNRAEGTGELLSLDAHPLIREYFAMRLRNINGVAGVERSEPPAESASACQTTGEHETGLSAAMTGPDSAQSDLDEAWEIASRGPMPLFLADIHLHRARLFGAGPVPTGRGDDGDVDQGDGRSEPALPYPWKSPGHDLAEARRLIEKHGYGRRKEELEDAETALLGRE